MKNGGHDLHDNKKMRNRTMSVSVPSEMFCRELMAVGRVDGLVVRGWRGYRQSLCHASRYSIFGLSRLYIYYMLWLVDIIIMRGQARRLL